MAEVKAAAVVADKDRNRWPELVYRLIEHYKWEPQHLGIGKKEKVPIFYKRVRQQEVPLNFLFQLLLRWSSSETISQILASFENPNLTAECGLGLLFPSDFNFIQPDVWIESERATVFIEIKVGAITGLEQVQKYLLLHAHLDNRDGEKRPYLLFLTESEFMNCWRPPPKAALANGIQEFLVAATASAALPKRLEKRAGKLAGRYEAVRSDVKYGVATWNSVGETLKAIRSQWKQPGSNDVEIRVVDDFLEDLKQRKLWMSGPD